MVEVVACHLGFGGVDFPNEAVAPDVAIKALYAPS
jgi:hypothetical protein